MKGMILATVLMFGLFGMGDLAFADGLVPCTGARGDECQACKAVDLINNVVGWLIGVLSIIIVLIIVYAGAKLVTSGGNPAAMQSAKSMMTNAIIGYIIVLGGWLFVDYGMKALFSTGDPVFGVWNEIQCVDQEQSRPYSLGRDGINADYGPSGNFGPDSGVGSQTACVPATTGPCSVSALEAAGFGSLAAAASQISGQESGCNPNAESRTDTTTDGRTYSVGTWQINMAVHKISCGGANLDCPLAFKKTGTRNKFNVREYEVINEELYQQCLAAAKNPECNNQIAAGLATRSRDMGDWACSAKKCGVSTKRNNLCPL